MEAKTVHLSRSDWEEIFAAVDIRLSRLTDEGPILMSKSDHERWLKQLRGVLQRIGPDSSRAIKLGVAPAGGENNA